MQVFAQEQVAPVDPEGNTELQTLDAAREREAAVFNARQVECYERFAVNDCLRKLQSRHLGVLAEIKRQETLLHDRERAQRGPEQLRRIEQKKQEKMQAAAQAEDAAWRAQEKLQSQQEKQAAHAARLEASGATEAVPAAPSGPGHAEQEAYRDAYAVKQAAAEKKRQEMAKRLKDKQGDKVVPPLPVPP
jgi:hypothetical protein